jgi:hypothetical protein
MTPFSLLQIYCCASDAAKLGGIEASWVALIWLAMLKSCLWDSSALSWENQDKDLGLEMNHEWLDG